MKKLYKSHVFLFVLAFMGCDLSFLKTNSSYQYSLVNADTEISQIPTEDFFYVNIKSAYYTGDSNTFDPLDFALYAMDEGPGTDCKISVNEQSSTEDLYCMLDVAEGDLWYHEINLEYNVPPSMCPYLGFYTHWHYNQDVGEGPRAVIEEEVRRGDDTITQYRPCVNASDIQINFICERRARSTPGDTSTSWDSADTAWGNTNTYSCGDSATDHCINKSDSNAEVKYTNSSNVPTTDESTATYQYRCERRNVSGCSSGGHRTDEEVEKVCKYNLSEQKGKANCCLGKYTVIKEDGSDSEEREWSGDISQCIGGLGRLSWSNFDDEGFPLVLVEEAGSRGLKKDYRLPPLIQNIKTRVSFPTANYFEGVEDKAGEAGENFPDFYKNNKICGREGTNTAIRCPTGHPYVTWTCLDQNQDELHRIHLLIREWNTKEELDDFKDSEGSRGDPDVVGSGGVDCEYYESEENFLRLFSPCNDIEDADDWTRGYPEINYGGSSGS